MARDPPLLVHSKQVCCPQPLPHPTVLDLSEGHTLYAGLPFDLSVFKKGGCRLRELGHCKSFYKKVGVKMVG